jgi:hypothetical protein
MAKKLKWIALLIVVGVAGIPIVFICVFLAGWAFAPCDPQEIAQVDVSDNRSVKFYADSCWEGSLKVYYEADESGLIVISRTLVDYFLPANYSAPEFTFRVASADNGAIVALYDPKYLEGPEMFVIIDFRTRVAWPINGNVISEAKRAELEVKVQDLFRRLKQANPDLPEPIDFSR